MPDKDVAVFGIYATGEIAENAVEYLVEKGFADSAISVLLPDEKGTRVIVHEKHTKAPEGTTAGMIIGGLIGGAFALLIGLGVLAVPSLYPLVVAGPVIAALTGVGSGGIVGGIIGALAGMGIPEFEAKRYANAAKRGGVLLAAHCETKAEVAKAKQALRETGAKSVSARGEEGSTGHTESRREAA
jgi:hypothetical protein